MNPAHVSFARVTIPTIAAAIAAVAFAANGGPAGTRPASPPAEPALEIGLLQPIDKIRGYRWKMLDDGRPLVSGTVEGLRDVAVRLPRGKVLCCDSKITFIDQISGVVTNVTLTPNCELLSHQGEKDGFYRSASKPPTRRPGRS